MIFPLLIGETQRLLVSGETAFAATFGFIDTSEYYTSPKIKYPVPEYIYGNI